MTETVHDEIESCFRRYGLPSVIADPLKHKYTELGIIGYEWMVQGFKENAWSRGDFFFFLGDTESEDDILSRHLQTQSLPRGPIEFRDLLYQHRRQNFGETAMVMDLVVIYNKQVKSIQISGIHENKDVIIRLDIYSDKESEFIIKPWITTGLNLLMQMTPQMLRLLNQERDVHLSTTELMYHAQPFMPVSVVYLIDNIDAEMQLVALSPKHQTEKPMFVHPLTPNIVTPDGEIILIATVVDDTYLCLPDHLHRKYMDLLCLYRYSQRSMLSIQ